MTPDRHTLAAGIAADDPAVVDAFCRECLTLARHAAYRLRAADPDDLAQTVAVRCWRARKMYDPKWSLSTWVGSVAHHEHLDRHRKARRRVTALDLDGTLIAAKPERPAPRRVPAWAWDLLALRMPARYVTLMRLIYQRGVTFRGAAVALGMPYGTVKSSVSRCLAMLREAA